MRETNIVIVGGGLSGLYAAYLLEMQGNMNYALLEAQDSLGGRILSTGVRASTDGTAADAIDRSNFDLGATWFWPAIQPELAALIQRLGLPFFEQDEAGDILIERSPTAAPLRMRGYLSASGSMRLEGGMHALISALTQRVDPSRVYTGYVVGELRVQDERTIVSDRKNEREPWSAEHVLIAVPPRLASNTIKFSPPLPDRLVETWRTTSTWMAPHAKYLAIYRSPFWREQGLSGEARSSLGPLSEIHDASTPGAGHALFGFFGVPASVRRKVGAEDLRLHCRAQMVRLFGPGAAQPMADFIKDWANSEFLSTGADLNVAAEHASVPPSCATGGDWEGILTGIASEWSFQYSGYIAGAIDAANRGVRALMKSIQHPEGENS